MEEENQKGSASAFATLSNLKDGAQSRFLELFALVHAKLTLDQEETMRERTFLHHALWVLVPAKKLRYPKIFAGRLQRKRSLLFLSYFTDDLLDYLRGFTDKLPSAMDALWEPTTGWKGASSYAETKKYVLEHRWRTDVYFNGRRSLNVGDARVARDTRRKLDKLARLLDPDEGDARFQRAYDDAVATAVGNVSRFGTKGPGRQP